MVTLIKRGDVWMADAHGHVLTEKYVREFKRNGAEVIAMSTTQFEGCFGNGILPEWPTFDGLTVVIDPTLPSSEVELYDAEGLMGRMFNLYSPPEPLPTYGTTEKSS
jgi:hypothetical protein